MPPLNTRGGPAGAVLYCDAARVGGSSSAGQSSGLIIRQVVGSSPTCPTIVTWQGARVSAPRAYAPPFLRTISAIHVGAYGDVQPGDVG